MIRREKMRALILSRRSVGEADRLVTLLTREKGLVRVLAKGARRIPSRRGGHLEPLTSVLALVRQGRVSAYLEAVETVNYYSKLHRDASAVIHARSLCFFTEALFEEADPQPRLCDAIEHSWSILPELSYEKRALLESAVALVALQQAGVMPELTACHVCGTRTPHESVILDARQGGWHCLLCHGSLQGTAQSLPPQILEVMRRVAAHPEHTLRIGISRQGSQHLLTAMREYISGIAGCSVTTSRVEDHIYG